MKMNTYTRVYNKIKGKRPPNYEHLHKTADFWIGVLVGGGAVALFFLCFFNLS